MIGESQELYEQTNKNIKHIRVDSLPEGFREWVDKLVEKGYEYEIIVRDGCISHIYVNEPDNGSWSDIRYGKVKGNSTVAFKQKVYVPVILNGLFVEDYHYEQPIRPKNRQNYNSYRERKAF